LFVNETVASLYEKVQTYQEEKEKQAE
jgi:hypothetical protein